jgi:hypothetical protein
MPSARSAFPSPTTRCWPTERHDAARVRRSGPRSRATISSRLRAPCALLATMVR